jgi:hypothetical protein
MLIEQIIKIGHEWVGAGSPNHKFTPLPAPASHHCAQCGGTKAGAQHNP